MDNNNPFKNTIQLEEITHFQKPHNKPFIKSILASPHKISSKKQVSYSSDLNKTPDLVPADERIFQQLSDDEAGESSGQVKRFTFDDSDEESDTEFRRDFTQLPTSGRDPSLNGSQDSGLDNHRQSNNSNNNNDFFFSAISDENLFPVSSYNVDVNHWDVAFSIVAFVLHGVGLVTDLCMAIWHYNDSFSWASALTFIFMGLGGIGMLQQFGTLQQDQLDRIFRKGKRIRILVNCFPPAATTFVSLEGILSACRANVDVMQSQQHFKISEVSRALSRVQSFLTSAPLAALQLIVLLENLDQTSRDKIWFTTINILVSLAVMTNANLPSKSDIDQNVGLNKAAHLPLTRIFVGLRMFCNLGSRTMAICYLFVGCRCILDSEQSSPISSTFVGIILLLFPRLIFTLTDYLSIRKANARNLEHYRDQPELGISSSHPIDGSPLASLASGYVATIYFPVGDPLWLFWYLWAEAGIFIVFGLVAGFSHNCVGHAVNWIYASLFILTFLVVPFLIPAAKVAVHKRKMQNVQRILQIVEDGSNNMQSSNANESISNDYNNPKDSKENSGTVC